MESYSAAIGAPIHTGKNKIAAALVSIVVTLFFSGAGSPAGAQTPSNKEILKAAHAAGGIYTIDPDKEKKSFVIRNKSGRKIRVCLYNPNDTVMKIARECYVIDKNNTKKVKWGFFAKEETRGVASAYRKGIYKLHAFNARIFARRQNKVVGTSWKEWCVRKSAQQPDDFYIRKKKSKCYTVVRRPPLLTTLSRYGVTKDSDLQFKGDVTIHKISYFVARGKSDVIVAIRGTSNAANRNMNNLGLPISVNGMKVHSGWWNAANTLYKDIKKRVNKHKKQKRLLITGHSMGGAVAGYLSYLFLRDKTNKHVSLITFGAPRFAGDGFSAKYSSLIDFKTDRRASVEMKGDTIISSWEYKSSRFGHLFAPKIDYDIKDASCKSCNKDAGQEVRHDYNNYLDIAKKRAK